MSVQIPSIFNPNNRFFYDDLLDLCLGSHRREDVNKAIYASIAYITTKSGMWVRKKEAFNGSIYFEFAPDLNGISPHHKVKIQSAGNEDENENGDESMSTTSYKLKNILLGASIKKVRYNDVVFRPYPPNTPWTSTKFFNLFMGFKAQPAPEIDRRLINPILRHILEVWCDGSKELAKYVANWLAYLVQHPDQKPGTALLMRSPPRCGKNILTDFIGEEVLGRENFYSTTRIDDVMGRFNGAIRAKKLIVLNECDMTGSRWHGANDQLKGLITEPYVSIEEKGIDIKRIDDFAGYMILSNHAMPIRIELGDERFVALDVSAKYKGNRKYFSELLRLLKRPDSASSFMAYLLSRDITGWCPRDVPNTRMKQELMEASMPNPQRFLLDYMDTDWLETDENIREISCKRFYEIYAQWCQDNGEPKMLSSNKFGMELKQFVSKTRPRSENRNYHYKLDRKDIMKKFGEGFGKSTVEQSEKKEVVTEPKVAPESPKEIPKKVPPQLPPKPDHLKVKANSSKSNSEPIKKAPEQEVNPSSIPLPESPKMKPVSVPEPIPKPAPEPYGIPGPSNTSAPEPKPMQPSLFKKNKKGEWVIDDDKINDAVKQATAKNLSKKPDPEPEPKVNIYMDKPIEDLYESAKKMWESNGGTPEDFDSECLALEIEDLPNHSRDPKKDYYHYSLSRAVQTYRNKINGRDRVSYDRPTYAEIAEKIRKYYNEERGQMHVTPPVGYKTAPIKKISECPQIDKKECLQAMGHDEECSDDEPARSKNNKKECTSENVAMADSDDDADEDWYESLKSA